ncbi:hypothetical protein F5X71_10130 [Nocardia brasiliensis]|uniref:Uncharacterized protein n=1 Tax=Nocardia brasiliensis TaxID=37326 RepID=A0A6G9XNZ5_NOCBR|nr:hypothetical protein [Nocardia brasiliensis]QIS02628.1 hypothetical protein F5X71_10130 [Nocardia brasiliensis]
MTMAPTGAVSVDHHQFLLTAAATDPTDITAESDLIWTGPGFVAVQAGIAYGPVTLTLDTTAESGVELTDWDIVEETVIESAEELLVISLDGHVAEQFAPVPPGRYRVRVHARGRDLNYDIDVTEPSETYLIQIQLIPARDDGGMGVITSLHTASGPGRPPAKTIPVLDYDHVYITGPDNQQVKVHHDSPQAHAVYAQRGTWSGRPPSPDVTADHIRYYSASVVADWDRDLVDDIDAIPPRRQHDLARWCAHRAFERAGLTAHADFRAALDAMDHDITPPPDFANASLLRHRIDTDPAITLTVVPGFAGNSERIPQHTATGSYIVAVDQPDPVKAAFDAVRFTAETYGPDYRQLFDRIRTEFLSNFGPDDVQRES